MRVPSWTSKGTVQINSATKKSLSPSNGLQAISVGAGTTKFTLNLPADVTIGLSYTIALTPIIALIYPTESRPHGSIAVHRGPLHYAYDIARTQKTLQTNGQQPLAVDLEFDATADWQYAIDPSTLRFNGASPAGGKLPSPVFDSGLPPFTIDVTACPINWPIAGDTFAASPPTNPACTGSAVNITLWPFGVSHTLKCTF